MRSLLGCTFIRISATRRASCDLVACAERGRPDVQMSDIQWSRYKEFEGPFTRGTVPYFVSNQPVEADRIMAVITATEGGRWNAVNMYDTCILTVGLIQMCERYYLVSNMLGAVRDRDPSLLLPMSDVLAASGASFGKDTKGRPRFIFDDHRGVVDQPQEQKQLFLLNSSGKRGSWDPGSISHAKHWAASMVNLFAQPDTIDVQRDYTVGMLESFIAKTVKSVLNGAPLEPLGFAFRAAYLSFAANNPTWAARNLQAADASSRADRYTLDWLIDVLRQLTLGPNVHIYPHRYNAIRPKLERLYGIDLPDTADLLKRELKQFMSVEEIQSILFDLGYDLGPYGDMGNGIDGVYKFGGKTYQAIADFQRRHDIAEDDDDKVGWVGDDTAHALVAAREELGKIAVTNTIDEMTRRSVNAQVNLAIARSLDDYFRSIPKTA